MHLKTTLFSYQQRAVTKLIGSRVGALFMDMGSGKTRTAIEFAYRRRQRIDRVVWFCPVSLKETILYEIEKHTDSTEQDIVVFDDETRRRTLNRNAFWYIVGIESMSSSDRVVVAVNELITPDSFVIVDESSYIKGHYAIRTRRITAVAKRARYRMILTGTPMSNGVQDLYAQMRFLSPRILGYQSFYSFAANHLEYSEKYPGMVVRAHNVDWLTAKIQPYVYQVTKDECLDLPRKLFDSRYFKLTWQQEAAYEQAKYEILMQEPDGELDSYIIFQLFSALQQIVSGFWNQKNGEVLEFANHRLPSLLDVIRSIPDDEKVIVWCKYRYSLHAIVTALAREYGEQSVAQFYGDLNERQRSAELRRFRKDARFFVATMATGSHGLTLNEARYSIFYENGFKYADRLQAEDRNHRIGQERRPTYIDIIGLCGIEKRIIDSLHKKGNALEDFRRKVDSMKDLSRAEVRKRLLEEL